MSEQRTVGEQSTEQSDTYDVIVIGAGPVGENAAQRVVEGGLTAVIVESELVGGECSYWACMPSKALLRPLEARTAALALPGSKQAVTGPIDTAAVLDRRDSFTSHWSDEGQVKWLDSAGIDLVRGTGRLTGEKTVRVTAEDGSSRSLTATHAVVLATGSAAAVPGIPGLREAKPWTSREATSAEQVPEHLVVIGGGVVGVEMATAWRGLGAEVTLLSHGGLLDRMENFAGELVADSLRESGVDVRTGAAVSEVRRPDAGGAVTVVLEGGDEVTGSEVLVAVGRTPQSGDLGLDTVGLEPGAYVEVEESLQVPDHDWLYAVGDVNGRALLTHMGKYQARAAGDLIVARATGQPTHTGPWGRHAATADHRAVTQVVFTDPQAGSVGLTEAEASEQYAHVRAVDYDLGAIAGSALHADGYTGRAKLVVDTDRQVVLGVTFVGPDIAELVQSAAVAVAGEVPLDRLWHAVPAYPTISEIWLRLLETYGR